MAPARGFSVMTSFNLSPLPDRISTSTPINKENFEQAIQTIELITTPKSSRTDVDFTKTSPITSKKLIFFNLPSETKTPKRLNRTMQLTRSFSIKPKILYKSKVEMEEIVLKKKTLKEYQENIAKSCRRIFMQAQFKQKRQQRKEFDIQQRRSVSCDHIIVDHKRVKTFASIA